MDNIRVWFPGQEDPKEKEKIQADLIRARRLLEGEKIYEAKLAKRGKKFREARAYQKEQM